MMVVSRWLIVIVLVRQPDIEMIAIGLDGDLVVVAMLREPEGGGDGGRLEIDEEQQAKREPPGEPAGDSGLEWLGVAHARLKLVNLPHSVKCGLVAEAGRGVGIVEAQAG